MAARIRKRVHAIFPPIRAPDGSAFIKCELCGASVPVAIADMHDCKDFAAKKRRKFGNKLSEIQERSEKELLRIERKSDEGLDVDPDDQIRSPFCFFMEEFSKDYEGDVLIKVYERGFEAWKNMSIEERSPYKIQAEEADAAYQFKISQEIGEIPKAADHEVNSPCNCYEDYSSGSDAYRDYESD